MGCNVSNVHHTVVDGVSVYRAVITRAQLDAVKHLNGRSKEEPRQVGFNADVVEIVDDVTDPRADMICGNWFGMTIGIMPDGSSHS